MRYLKSLVLPAIAISSSSFASYAQSTDEQIASAMNASDWFALYDLYYSAPKDSINPFMDVYSRCLIGNRLNRPDISIPAFQELFSSYSGSLDPQNAVSSTLMYAMDLNRTGENAKAASVIGTMAEALKQHIDSTSYTTLTDFSRQFSELSRFSPYSVSFTDGDQGLVPFNLKQVGPAEKASFHIRLEDSAINGIPAEITFDTGAGVNVITDSLAERYGLVKLDAGISVMGLGETQSRMAIANELRMGNIVVNDVPFHIIDLSSGNEDADKYLNELGFIVGSELMLQLKDVTIDFANKRISVPAKSPDRSEDNPNMCFSSSRGLLAQGTLLGQALLFNIDTGDSDYGSLNAYFYEQNKEMLESTCKSDTVRMAGVGGVSIQKCYKLENAPLNIGNAQATIPACDVLTEHSGSETWNNLGLKSLMMFSKVRFNLVDFIFTATPYPSVSASKNHEVPSFKIGTESDPNVWYTIGSAALEVVREIATHN